jgi:hypothetical protein
VKEESSLLGSFFGEVAPTAAPAKEDSSLLGGLFGSTLVTSPAASKSDLFDPSMLDEPNEAVMSSPGPKEQPSLLGGFSGFFGSAPAVAPLQPVPDRKEMFPTFSGGW